MTGRLYQVGTMWYMAYTHRGKEYRYSCRTTSKEQAKGKLDMQLAKIRVTGFAGASCDIRLEDLIADSIAEYKSTNRDRVAKAAERNWRLHLQPFFRRAKISELGTSDFTEYRNHRLAQGAAQASINLELQAVISAYKIGYRCQPPKVERMPYIKLLKVDNARRTFISPEQRDKLFAAASREGLWARIILEMAYLLGWRRGELLGLTVGCINVVDRTVRLGTTKNGEAREVPMTTRLAMLVQQLVAGRQPHESLFPVKTDGAFDWVWTRIRESAGCPDVKFHDWRRTSARTKRAAGVPEGVIMEMQGWKTAAMFRRYAIVNQDDKRHAMELVDIPAGGKA